MRSNRGFGCLYVQTFVLMVMLKDLALFPETNHQSNMNNEQLQEILQNLEEDGIQYAHFFSHPAHSGYYGIMVRERTPEYIRTWLPHGPLREYSLELSLAVDDASFKDYMLALYPDQIQVKDLHSLCRIENISNTQKWIDGFKAWKQEQIRLSRVKFLEQYPWEVTAEKKTSL